MIKGKLTLKQKGHNVLMANTESLSFTQPRNASASRFCTIKRFNLLELEYYCVMQSASVHDSLTTIKKVYLQDLLVKLKRKLN